MILSGELIRFQQIVAIEQLANWMLEFCGNFSGRFEYKTPKRHSWMRQGERASVNDLIAK